ncbi:MAG: hypothetical protein V5A72_01045 [Candidatus Nanohaloarchaea archaeon]
MTDAKESIKNRIKDSNPVDNGWTNRVYETSEGTIIKVFSTHFFEALIFGSVDFLHGKSNIPFRNERLEKEVEMKQTLEKKGYSVPVIIEVYSNALEMERIEGKSIANVIEELDLEEVRKLGEKTGDLVSSLHSEQISLGDATLENFYIDSDKIYTIDHEYGSLNSDSFDKERDVVHILSDALEQETEKYQAFRKGFEKSYREFASAELIAATAFSIFTSLLAFQLQKLKRTLFNVVKI